MYGVIRINCKLKIMNGGFWNTIGLGGEDLVEARRQVSKQEEIVLDIFTTCGDLMTPYEVWERLVAIGKIYPLTSVRRAITNLTKEGMLEKTNHKVKGGYGTLNYCWRLTKLVS